MFQTFIGERRAQPSAACNRPRPIAATPNQDLWPATASRAQRPATTKPPIATSVPVATNHSLPKTFAQHTPHNLIHNCNKSAKIIDMQKRNIDKTPTQHAAFKDALSSMCLVILAILSFVASIYVVVAIVSTIENLIS
jgi:hypothetical protein